MIKLSSGLTRRRVLKSAAALSGLAATAGSAGASLAAAPLLGASVPTHYRFKLGGFEVTTILDAAPVIGGPWPIVGENQPEAEVEQLMRQNLLPEKRFQPGFTPTLVNTGKELILFDTGNGEDGFVPRPHGGWLDVLLSSAGFRPEQVDIVVLTHGHSDHIGGLIVQGAPAFPNARYIIGALEFDYWSSKHRLSAPPDGIEYQSAALFQAAMVPLASRTSFIKPGESVVTGIDAVKAFGHTPGHLAFHIESEGKRLLLWGDCAHHEVASLARPDWHAFFDMDKQMGAETRKKIFGMTAADRIPVIGYHMSFPSVGYVEPDATSYRWIPVSYQLSL